MMAGMHMRPYCVFSISICADELHLRPVGGSFLIILPYLRFGKPSLERFRKEK
jgi:hypothetical protein